MADDEGGDVTTYLSCLATMKSDRSTYDTWCQEVADLTLPKRDFTTHRSANTSRKMRIYDSTGVWCTTALASGLHGNLTPTTSKWFAFDPPKQTDDEGRKWLNHTEDTLFRNFAEPGSLFSSQSFEMYLDLVAFGQGVMIPLFIDGRVVYRSRPLNACWIRENDEGIVDTLYYECEKRPIDLIRYMKKNDGEVHKNVQQAYEDGKVGKIKVLHVVEPRDEHYGRDAVATAKPFKSVYIDVTNQFMMKESGYNTFPYLVPRFSKRSGETYGYGAGHDAMPEVRTANKYAEVMFRAAAKNVDPPALLPSEGVVLPLKLDPNGINYYDPTGPKPEFWQNGFNPNYLAGVLKDKQALIKSLYYIDWMNMPDRGTMTASEFIGRSQESMRNMAPINSRLEAEFLARLIERSVELNIANGVLPPPPPSLQGNNVGITYTSPLAQAQRAANSNAVLSGLTIASQLAQFDPSVVANVNANAIFRDQALSNFNWPVEYLHTLDEVEATQAAQREQQQVAGQAQTAETYSKAAKNGADTLQGLTGGTA